MHVIKYYAFVFSILFSGLLPLESSAIDVITHSEVKDTSLTSLQLRRIFTMRQSRWSDNTPISIFVLPSQHDIHQRFSKEHLKIFSYQLNRIWHKLTYSGLGVAPTIVQSEQELVQAVINTPGAIGYLHDTELIKNWQLPTNAIKEQPVNFEGAKVDQNTVAEDDNVDIHTKGVVNVIQVYL